MDKLFRKVASRFRRGKSRADVSWYTERYQTLPQSTGANDVLQSPTIASDQTDKQSKLKAWTNRLKRTTRRKDLAPNPTVAPTSLLSCNSSSCATISSPPASYLAAHEIDKPDNNAMQPSFSESTVEIDPEFGFSMRRMRGDVGLNQHDNNTPPRLYLDMSRQRNTFSPFRPFSSNILLPSLDTSDASLSRNSPRYFSTGSFDRFRSISASLAAADTPASAAAAAAAPSRTVSVASNAKNRFYSQSNLDALGVTRAPTADSGLSPTSLLSGACSPTPSNQPPYSFRSFSSQSHTMRSLSAELLSLSSRKKPKSLKSPIGSRDTSPSFSLASPISFC